MTFEQNLEKYIALTEKAINEYLSNKKIPEKMQEAMKYSALAPGKRLRPALLINACEICGGKAEDALPFAVAIELIHTYSLIHDDLPALDNDDMRRGRLTSHKKFGEAEAILAGDALLSYAFEIMLEATDKFNKIKASREIAIAAGATKMVAGQWVDVTLNGQAVDKKTMEYIHLNKTAAMIIGATKAGAFVADADEEKVLALSEYSRAIGYTFQIVDDILDVEGDSNLLGKNVGSDEANNKMTFVKVYGLEGAKKQAEEYTQKAIKNLEGFGEKAEFMRQLATYLLNRKK